MKKKIELLLHDGQAAKDRVFTGLRQNYQTAKESLDQAKADKATAKSAYHTALRKHATDEEQLFVLLTAFRQAKCQHLFHRAGFQLAKYRLNRWADAYHAQMDVPHGTTKKKAAKAEKSVKKAEKPEAAPKKTGKAKAAPADKPGKATKEK